MRRFFGIHSSKMLVLLTLLAVTTTSATPKPRIIGGVEVTIEELPYQVALNYRIDTGPACGGAILSPKHILTVAHCIYGEFNVRLGSTYNAEGGKVFDIANVTVPPNNYDYAQDVAVITLTEPIQFGPSAQPISIIPNGEEPKHGEMLLVTGWGMTSYYEAGPANQALRAVRLPTINRKMCDNVYQLYNRNITAAMICAGGRADKKNAYKGDSGGPVVNSEHQVVGRVSWGKPSDEPGHPTVLTNVGYPPIHKLIREALES